MGIRKALAFGFMASALAAGCPDDLVGGGPNPAPDDDDSTDGDDDDSTGGDDDDSTGGDDDDSTGDDDDSAIGDDDDSAEPDGPFGTTPSFPGLWGCSAIRAQSAWCVLPGDDYSPTYLIGIDDGTSCLLDDFRFQSGSSVSVLGGDFESRETGQTFNASTGLGTRDPNVSNEVFPMTNYGNGWAEMDDPWGPVMWAAAATGFGGPLVTFPFDLRASQLAGGDESIVTSWHSTEEVDIYNPVTGVTTNLVLGGYDGWVLGLDFLPGDQELAIIGWDREVRVFDVVAGTQLHNYPVPGPYGTNGLACFGPEPAGGPRPVPSGPLSASAAEPTISGCAAEFAESAYCLSTFPQDNSKVVGLDTGTVCTLATEGLFGDPSPNDPVSSQVATVEGFSQCNEGLMEVWNDAIGLFDWFVPAAPCGGMRQWSGGVVTDDPLGVAVYASLADVKDGLPTSTISIAASDLSAATATDVLYVPSGPTVNSYDIATGSSLGAISTPGTYEGQALATMPTGDVAFYDTGSQAIRWFDPTTGIETSSVTLSESLWFLGGLTCFPRP